MVKHIYKAIILIIIFIGALYYFGRDVKEEVFNVEQTTEMSKASFPTITVRVVDSVNESTGEGNSEEINLTHGYSNNINANMVRESITPLDSNQSFEVVIDEKEKDVKRVIYELHALSDNKLLESGTINALEKEGEKKTAKINLKTILQEEMEYGVKITLVTSESKKMNYYTHVELLPTSYYKEKIDFCMNFHNSIMDRKKAKNIIDYLETEPDTDNSTLAYVNIHSSFNQVSWGKLKPEVVSTIVPTIKEIDMDTASVQLNYTIKAKTDSGEEYYNVKEFYRVRYTSSRMYLLNYERTMESIFDLNLASVSQSQIKIGITNNPVIDIVSGTDNNKMAFVRQGQLWYYDLTKNAAVRVFSFLQKDTDYIRDNYGEHDIRILSMDEDGNINFMVYGYMNRGVYEGRVGIVVYKYYSKDNRIEELIYIPVNVTYQILKEELGSFCYVNQFGTFYFTLKKQIYSYNVTTRELKVIASNMSDNNYVVSKEQHFLAWQNNSNPVKSEYITLLDLETGEEKKIEAPEGSQIILLGKIDNNIIYGYVKAKSITTNSIGEKVVPMHRIIIADTNLKILKEYYKKGYYTTHTTVQDNVITLDRVKRINGMYESAEPDSILNNEIVKTEVFGTTTRVTEKTLTEFYLTLPAGFTMQKLPKQKNTINTVITEDTTLRLEEEEILPDQFSVYGLGDIKGIYKNAGDAINQANQYFGSVFDKNQKLIWKRSFRRAEIKLDNITPIYTDGNRNSIMACVQMMINYRNGGIQSANFDLKKGSAYEMLKQNVKDSALNLTGCTLDEILYYINQNKPVIAMKDADQAVLIIGYDTYNITVIDPATRTTKKVGLQDATQEFQNAGNLFVTYFD